MVHGKAQNVYKNINFLCAQVHVSCSSNRVKVEYHSHKDWLLTTYSSLA